VEKLFSVLDAKFFRELIGLFEINTSAISFFGPIYHTLHDKTRVTPEQRARAEEILRSITTCCSSSEGEGENEEEVESNNNSNNEEVPHHNHGAGEDVCATFESFEGIGIFERVAVMNHSCDPNCVTQFCSDWNAEVVALRDIAAGEEVAHSYIGVIRSFEERSQMLRLWGFKCVCRACRDEVDV
jgi:hypothetical protein